QTGGDFLAKLDAAANTTTGTPNAAVNVSDLKSTADALKANERHIAPTTVAAGSTETKGGTANAAGTNVYKYDAASKTVTLTYNDGNGNAVTDTKAVIDLSNLSTGGTGASSWNVKSSANTTDGGAVGDNHNANVQNIADTKTVEFQSGKNLVVKQTNDTTNGNATVEFSLADNIVAGKDGANGKDGSVGATGKDGSSVVLNGKDGSIGMTGPKGQDGKDGINGRDGADISITSAKGEQVLVNRDPAHNSDTDKAERIVYVPKDASGNPIQDANGKNIVREVATMDDGLRFTGNNTGTENKRKLGSLVKVQGEDVSAADEAAFQSAGGNIAVTADGTDTLTIRLNKNLKGLNSIQLGDNTIKSNGDNIEFTTKGGDTKTVATTDQLWTIQANGVDVPAKSGKVNLVAGDHITITPDAANGKMTISATGFGSMDGFNVKTSADANGTHAGDTTENIKNGKTVDMQAGKNLVVTQSNDGNGNTTVNYALNKDVDLSTNGSLKTGDTTINNDGFKNGNTTVGGNGMTINNPTDPAKIVSLTKDGLNNGGNQITNVASGGNTDTNGANIGDVKRIAKAGDTRIKDDTYTVDNTGTVELTYVDGAGKQVTDAAGNPLKAKITGITTLDSTRVNVAVNKTGTGEVAGSTAPVKVTKGTEFVAGNNLIVERKAHTGNDLDNSVVYSLNSNLTGINSISNTTTGPKMTFGGNSINVTNGDLNMGGNKITNLAPGKDKTDAATVGQLTKVTSNNHSVVINQTTDANGAPVYDLAVTGTPGAPAADPRVDMLGEEIGRVGAQGAALSALKPIQYDPLEPTQIMAGYGNYRGNSALALGVAHYKNESTLIHGGVSWAGGSSHMMANAGVTWKVGNRDSEAAVADRYRKGPISSAYAMQQEMASVKAQNAGLKSEVSDLKAENEQMKAQIAAMMAKLGM
ncbi:YadA-like family protein, partial [Veillonella fallax]